MGNRVRDALVLSAVLVVCAAHGLLQRLRGEPITYWWPGRGARRV